MGLNAPHWLIAHPIAHRGLHDARYGVVENTLAAAEGAIARHMAIECDVRASADGEAMVFHDATLDRLTHSSGALAQKTTREIQNARFSSGAERIPTFRELLDRVAGRTPVICEIKSQFDGDMRLANRVAQHAVGYGGPLALKSFDPVIIAHFRHGMNLPGPPNQPCPLGIVAQAHYDDENWSALSADQKINIVNFLHYFETRPDFLSYCVDDLPNAIPFLLRTLSATPVMAWTVRTQAQRRLAAQWADQIVFEGDLSR
ncbi:MAG: glycerophosphodiester phosphodiesterase family protein [Roseiarcus sp.]